MYLKYRGEEELDALGFRSSLSKAHLCSPHLYGSVAMPHPAETTHLPVSAPPHHSKDRWKKHYFSSHTEKWRSFSSPLHLQHSVLSTQGGGAASCTVRKSRWRIWIKQTFVWWHPNHPSFFMNTCHLQGKVQCWIIEGSHYSLEIFVNPIHGVGSLLTFFSSHI